MMKSLRFVLAAAVIITCALGAGCGGDDDDDDSSETPGDDDGPTVEPAAWADRTGHDAFLDADAWFAQGIYSVAMLYYDEAVVLLTDDFEDNDGPDAAQTLDRARYGYALTTITIPLKIIEGFVASLLAGDTQAIVDALAEDYKDRTGEDELPTNLLTIYIREWILPEIELANERLDAAVENAEFSYAMPVMRVTMFGTAIRIPDATDPDERGRHDLVEANFLSLVLHVAEWLMRSVLSYNIDMDVARIDDILRYLNNGDIAELLGMVARYPNLLTPSTPETNGVDGAAMLMAAYDEFTTVLGRFRDDDDRDGEWNPFADAGERPDDLLDALWLDGGEQTWDVLLRTEDGLGLNIRANGESLRGSDLEQTLNNVLVGLVTNDVWSLIVRTAFGHEPPEANPRNGIDDDLAIGVSTIVEPGLLIDAAASFTPHTLAGRVLDPNVNQGETGTAFELFTILDNTDTHLYVFGDPTRVAQEGDYYSIGDGVVDDEPLPVGFLLPLLGIGDWPVDSRLGLFYGSFFARVPDVRDMVPAWDADLGDPDFYRIVVDRTESFDDVNGNDRYDPGTDVLHDAAHDYGAFRYPADGRYQPYYVYLGDPTWGGLLHYSGDVEDEDRNNLLNLLVSALLPLLAGTGEAQP